MSKTAPSDRAEGALLAIQGITGGKQSDGVSRLIYERLRLAIISALAVKDSLSFSELKAIRETTDGNLSMHTRKLEDGGLIRCRKKFSDRVPRTDYSITPKGRRALEEYLSHMEQLVKSMK